MSARALAVLLAALAAVPAQAKNLPPGFVRLAEVAPSIRQDMRYAGSHNFMGRRAPGYGKAQCWLRREAALALAEVQREVLARDQSLVVYDCYRPQRAVEGFYRWAMNPRDQARRREFYPEIEKSRLFALGYIARQSSHSTGLAVDLGVDGVDFGTSFDFFDPRSNTANTKISPKAAENRRALVERMARHGFKNLPEEWWHFSYGDAAPAKSFDVEIR